MSDLGADTRPDCILCESDSGVKLLFEVDGFDVLRCSGCQLTFLNLLAAPPRFEELYSEEYFLERKGYFFVNPSREGQEPEVQANLKEFTEGLRLLAELGPGERRLLDVGCGVGVFLSIAKAHDWRVTGVDISEFASRYAREHFQLDARHGTLESLHIEPGSFDAVTMWDMIEHVPNPIEELRRAREVLTCGGYVLLNTPNENSLLKALAHACYAGSGGRFRYPVRKLYHVYHLFYFTEVTIRRVLERAGFEVVKILRTSIPLSKARGSRVEKAVVGALSGLERVLEMQYQLLVVGRKT